MEPNVRAQHQAEMRELLGAYALGAVTQDEAEELRAFLASDTAAQDEMAELWLAADALPLLAEPLAPPPALRDRISAAILAEANEGNAAGPPASEPVALAPPPAIAEVVRPEPSFWQRTAPWATAAAALLLVTLGLLFWNLQLRNELGSQPTVQTVALAPGATAPGASGSVHYSPQEQLFVVDVQNLPPLPEGSVYEVWLIGEGGPVPAGTFDSSTARHAIVADRSQYSTLAITMEPGPLGTMAPTSDIVVSAPL